MKKLFLSNLLFLLLSTLSVAQIVEVPLQERLHHSKWVFEGKILRKSSFWNAEHNHIYTSNIVKVGKVFKGNCKINGLVEVITEGGIIDTLREEVSPCLKLSEADLGIFMGIPHSINLPPSISKNGLLKVVCYADEQGFIKYDPITATASDPFATYGNIHKELHKLIKKLIKNKENLEEGTSLLSENSAQAEIAAAATIISFSPTTVTAGTRTVLTINGSGFEATQGTGRILFSNADNGGRTIDVAPLASQYRLWTDTQIQVEVPSGAGTGPFRILTNSGSSFTSPTSLTIQYNITNVTYNGTAYIPRLVNLNGSGGYTWQMNTLFYNNTGARAAFTRAMETWRCGTFVNFSIGAVTSNNTAARDGIIVIRFDQGSELPAGVLGRCVSYYSGCISGSSVTWYVSEFDITFDDATTWNYSTSTPSISQYDFQSVALHELGHGHQLGHVINTSDVMHYAIANGQTRRTLNADDINGGRFIINLSTTSSACGYGVMIALNSSNCSLPVPAARNSTPDNPGLTSSYDNNSWLLPNPFEKEATLTIQTAETINLTLAVMDLQGRVVWKGENLRTNQEIRLGSELASGIYIVQAEYEGKISTIRIVKK